MKIQSIILLTLIAFNLASCKKSKKEEEQEIAPINPSTLKTDILVDVSSNVIYATYTDLANKANTLNNSILTFSASPTASNLTNAQQAWKDVRSAWEQGEGFLFGPVSVNDIDPRIDTWPIDFARIDSVLTNGPTTFDASYINSLEESLKGFHPLEYFLYGKHSNVSQFTSREIDLMIALSDNLTTLCNQAKSSWDPSLTGNYTSIFNSAGPGNTIYQTQRAAYEEMVDAMAGICDEVANGKITEPFVQQDPTKEESPFAHNSITDFTNNIKSVQNVYLGKYISDGKGLEDLIKANNLSMDGQIKTKITNAITALNNVTDPFGTAITTQQVQVQNCITAINDLKTYLEGTVKPYVQTLTN